MFYSSSFLAYAVPETRTRKSLRTLEPESSASTNSASTADVLLSGFPS